MPITMTTSGNSSSRRSHDDPPLFEKLEAFKKELGAVGETARDVVLSAAHMVSISSEGKTVAQIASEVWHVLYGGSSAPPGDYQDMDNLSVDKDSTAGSLMDRLTEGEQRAECCICFDDLHARPIGAFTCQGKRTCPHFFHDDCASELLKSGGVRPDRGHTCPLCRRSVDARVRVPKASEDPEGWFKCVDGALEAHAGMPRRCDLPAPSALPPTQRRVAASWWRCLSCAP